MWKLGQESYYVTLGNLEYHHLRSVHRHPSYHIGPAFGCSEFYIRFSFWIRLYRKKMYFQMLEEIGIPEEKNRLELELLSEPVRP